MQALKIGISVGDINGIGPEVIVKALSREGILDLLTPVIYASERVFETYTQGPGDFELTTIESADAASPDSISLISCWDEPIEYNPGQPKESGGRAAAASLDRAVADLKAGKIDALVTAPINKSVMPRDAFPFPGHTEMLTTRLEAEESLMLLVADELRVGVVTNHIPVSEVAAAVTKEKILAKLKIMNAALRADFGIVKPLIAVLALNPHAGDEGLIGTEDAGIVRPAIEAAKNEGIMALGPFPADGLFGSGNYRKFDAILAMYHDQGLVAFKALSFGQGVNFTAGLPAIRTSPDHGTAYDLVGKDTASPDSFLSALFLAHDAYINRSRHAEDTANPLQSRMHEVYKRRPKENSGKKGRR